MQRNERNHEWVGLIGIPLIVIVSYFLTTWDVQEEYLGVADAGIRLLILIGLVFLLKKPLVEHWHQFKRMKRSKWLWIILGMLSFHIALILVRLVLPQQTEAAVEVMEEGVDFLEVSWSYFGLIAVASLVPVITALIEEMTFRYLLVERLLNGSVARTVLLVLFNGILFGAIHVYNVGGLYSTIPYMVVGALMATYYVRFRNIWVLIFMHLLYNGLLTIIPIFFIGIARLFM